jgi:hypothetical protein
MSGNQHLVPSLAKRGCRIVGTRDAKKEKRQKQPADWRLALEQIGRELRKVYRRPARLSRRLRAVVLRLERKTR